MTCQIPVSPFLTDSQSALCILSSAPSYLLPESFWYVWSLASSLSNNTSLSFQWVPDTQVSPEMKKRIYLPKLVPLCPLMRSQVLSPPVSAKVRYCQYRNWRRHISHSHLNFQVPKSLFGGSFFFAPYAVSFPVFAAMVTVFFYLHIFTGSVGKEF